MPSSAGEPDRKALGEWLATAGFELREARPLPGDVSPRRYQRVTAADGATAILALYPAELLATCARFTRTTEILADAGIPVPLLLAVDVQVGWMLLEDLGERTLAELRNLPWSDLTRYFEDAAGHAVRIAGLPPELVRDLNPPLDQALMKRELDQTRQLFLEPLCIGDAALTSLTSLDGALSELCRQLAADPPVPCHRDYMARNLMPRSSGKVAVLDHQDLRLGPPAYDLASLLNDTLFPPPELEDRLVQAAFPGPDGKARYHRAAAQRTLKAVGTYAAFARRGSDRHVPLIGPTFHRFLRHFGRLPEGERLVPALAGLWTESYQP